MDREEITVTVDPQLKASAEELFQDLGLDLSTAVTMFLKASIARQGLPFEVKRNTQNDELLARVAAYLEVNGAPDQKQRYESYEDLLHNAMD